MRARVPKLQGKKLSSIKEEQWKHGESPRSGDEGEDPDDHSAPENPPGGDANENKWRYMKCPYYMNVDPPSRTVPTLEDGHTSEDLYGFINRAMDEHNYAEVESGIEVLLWEKHEVPEDTLSGLYQWMGHEYGVRFLCYLNGSINDAESVQNGRDTMKPGESKEDIEALYKNYWILFGPPLHRRIREVAVRADGGSSLCDY